MNLTRIDEAAEGTDPELVRWARIFTNAISASGFSKINLSKCVVKPLALAMGI